MNANMEPQAKFRSRIPRSETKTRELSPDSKAYFERASERSREIQAANRELRQLATPCRSLTVKPPPEEESTAVVHRSGWANTSLACGKGVLPDAGHFDSALPDFCGHPPVEVLGNNSCSLEMFSHFDLFVDFLSCS